jgi:DNA-binding LytR/AlgR family response regulator
LQEWIILINFNNKQNKANMKYFYTDKKLEEISDKELYEELCRSERYIQEARRRLASSGTSTKATSEKDADVSKMTGKDNEMASIESAFNRVDINKVHYIEATGNYICLYSLDEAITVDGKKKCLIRLSLKQAMRWLGKNGFARANKRHAVNVSKAIFNEGLSVIVIDDTHKFGVTTCYVEEVKKTFRH